MKKILSTILATVLAASMLAGCADSKKDSEKESNKATVTVKNTYTDNVKIPVNPKKVAVFDMAVLDSIKAMNIDVEIAAPVSSIPESLSEYKKSVNAGDIKEPDMEKLFEFEPDLIIISGRQADFQEELQKIAPVWYVDVNYENLLESLEREYTYFGEIFNKQDKVKEKINSIKTSIEKFTKENAITEKALILLTNNGKISAYGTGSRFGLIHDVLKVPVADDTLKASTHGQEVGYEYISKTNPDIIYVIDRTVIAGGNVGASDVMDNALVKTTNAYKNNKIVYLDPELWYLVGFGLNSMEQMISEIDSAV